MTNHFGKSSRARIARNWIFIIAAIALPLARCTCGKTTSSSTTQVCEEDVDITDEFLSGISNLAVADEQDNSLLSSQLAFYNRNVLVDNYVNERVTLSLSNGYYLGLALYYELDGPYDYRALEIGQTQNVYADVVTDTAQTAPAFADVQDCALALTYYSSLAGTCLQFTASNAQSTDDVEVTRASESEYQFRLLTTNDDIGNFDLSFTAQTEPTQLTADFPQITQQCDTIQYNCFGDCSGGCEDGYIETDYLCEDEGCTRTCEKCEVIGEDGTALVSGEEALGLSAAEINELCDVGSGNNDENLNLL